MSEVKLNPNCPCSSACPRHGNCIECRKHHQHTGTPTACEKLPKK